jgi:hypothetical protein
MWVLPISDPRYMYLPWSRRGIRGEGPSYRQNRQDRGRLEVSHSKQLCFNFASDLKEILAFKPHLQGVKPHDVFLLPRHAAQAQMNCNVGLGRAAEQVPAGADVEEDGLLAQDWFR